MSNVLPLDFILHVNGASVSNVPLSRIKKIISSAGDQMVLSVMASSPCRLLTTYRDILAIMHGMATVTVVIKAAAISCFGTKPFGIDVIDVDVVDDKVQAMTKCFVILRADVPSSNDKKIFPGDVLLEIDGTAVRGMTRQQIDSLLSCGKPEMALSVVPLSPMRKKRFLLSKIQETCMTDMNLPSKSTGAEIDCSPSG
ncbi:uncharacterized protein LOC144180733 [Haemaphysalis longicornis]